MERIVIDEPGMEALIQLFNRYRPGVIVLVARDPETWTILSDYSDAEVSRILKRIAIHLLKNYLVHN